MYVSHNENKNYKYVISADKKPTEARYNTLTIDEVIT